MTNDGDEITLLARKAHGTLEPIHVLVYFVPEAGDTYLELGLKGGMRQYFASRSAAVGIVAPQVVTAMFYNFNPASVANALPSAWDVTTPELMLAARISVVDAAMRRILDPEIIDSEQMAEAAALAREACSVLGAGLGRPLYAAHAALEWPAQPHLQLWHAQTLLREYRGDGHIAALLLAGLDGIEALASYLPLGKGLPEPILKATRGWDDSDWDAAQARLRDRGLLDETGGYTPAGKAQREQIEAQTDQAARAPWEHLGPEDTNRLRELVRPWSRAISDSVFGGGQ